MGEGTRCGVNARALSLARKAVDLCNCRRREAAAECLVETWRDRRSRLNLFRLVKIPSCFMVVATL